MSVDDRPISHPRLAAPWLSDAAIQAVVAALSSAGARPRFVGGCVRNALLAAGPTDVDIAIDRPPEETIRLLETAGLRAIPTGVEHGTVTTLAGDEPLEITSLRRDVATDGRRAVVAFSRDWAEDAARRDFTMNALYADPDGRVIDPLGGGLADLAAGRIRFIGDPEQRIREDHLRSLRYFRFHAWYGRAPLAPEDLAATRRLAAGVDGLARERIWAELKKLLAAPRAAEGARLMAEAGILTRVAPSVAGLDDLPRLDALAEETGAPLDWRLRLLALLGPPPSLSALADALRPSRAELKALQDIAAAAGLPPAEAGYRLGPEAAWAGALLRALTDQAPPGSLTSDRASIHQGSAAVFPLKARHLIAAGVAPGPAIGAGLAAAERAWIASGFALDHGELLACARTVGARSADRAD